MKAILLMAYGTPEDENDVEAYYTHIRRGRVPTKEEVENLKERYKLIGGKTSLLNITVSTAKKLEESLQAVGHPTKVFAGMKHWHPYISEVFPEIASSGVDELLAIALAPHYSKMSVGSYQAAVLEAQKETSANLHIRFIDSWHLNYVFIQKWVERVKRARANKFNAQDKEIYHLFSAHSLPERILSWNDPYKSQLTTTMEEIARRLNLSRDQYGFAFQSAGHTSEPWLGPDILGSIARFKDSRWRNILVIPIGFVSDHLEILYDLDFEAKQASKSIGAHLERTDSFNDSSDFIEVLGSVITESGFLETRRNH
ncbi:MAG: ferrochelatase [Nitrososphaerota archaeon]|nr:ferrochelatase [Nitrososphaerota archaeon]